MLQSIASTSTCGTESESGQSESVSPGRREFTDENIEENKENVALKTINGAPPSSIPRPLKDHFKSVVAVVLEEQSTLIRDIDKESSSLYNTLYAKQIMKYLRSLEVRRRLPADYLEGQTESLTFRSRSIIVDWLIQVQHYLKLKQETLYLTTQIFDRFFLRVTLVPTDKLQLVAVACILIASKIEERFTPEIKVLMHLTDDAYSLDSIVKMERYVLRSLKFKLVMAEPMVFLNRCIQAAGDTPKELENMSTFFIDTILPDIKVCRQLLPSKMAAAAFCLARKIVLRDQTIWCSTLKYYSGYKEDELKEVMVWMLCAVADSSNPKHCLQGARKKYASNSRYQGLSNLPVFTSKAVEEIINVWG